MFSPLRYVPGAMSMRYMSMRYMSMRYMSMRRRERAAPDFPG